MFGVPFVKLNEVLYVELIRRHSIIVKLLVFGLALFVSSSEVFDLWRADI